MHLPPLRQASCSSTGLLNLALAQTQPSELCASQQAGSNVERGVGGAVSCLHIGQLSEGMCRIQRMHIAGL